jgi:hypothetical protein
MMFKSRQVPAANIKHQAAGKSSTQAAAAQSFSDTHRHSSGALSGCSSRLRCTRMAGITYTGKYTGRARK